MQCTAEGLESGLRRPEAQGPGHCTGAQPLKAVSSVPLSRFLSVYLVNTLTLTNNPVSTVSKVRAHIQFTYSKGSLKGNL